MEKNQYVLLNALLQLEDCSGLMFHSWIGANNFFAFRAFLGPKRVWGWFCGPLAGPVSAMMDASVNGAASAPIQQLHAYFDTVPKP